MLSEQDEAGEWIKTSISTGTGSLHLGDLHNNGSGGEQVTWVNTDSLMAYSPPWGAVSTDGATVYENKARTYEALVISEPNGALNASLTPTPYDLSLTATGNTCFFAIEIVPTESYTGALEWLAIKSTGKPAEFKIRAYMTSRWEDPRHNTTLSTGRKCDLKANGLDHGGICGFLYSQGEWKDPRDMMAWHAQIILQVKMNGRIHYRRYEVDGTVIRLDNNIPNRDRMLIHSTTHKTSFDLNGNQ